MLRTRAQSIVEYAVLVVAIVGVVIAAAALLAGQLKTLLSNVITNINFSPPTG